jgi:hypothetical protein
MKAGGKEGHSKSTRIRYVYHLILGESSKWKRPIEDVNRMASIKIDLKEIECESVAKIHLAKVISIGELLWTW